MNCRCLFLMILCVQGFSLCAQEDARPAVPDFDRETVPEAVDSLELERLTWPWRFREQQQATFPLKALLNTENRGRSSLQFRQEQGDFQHAQMPGRTRVFGLSSQGNRRMGQFRAEGYFSYQKQLDDSLGWIMSREPGSMPYYMAIIKKGQWDRELFDLGFHLARPLLKERLRLALGADYKLQKHARTIDTRSVLNYYYLDLKLQAAWQLTPEHELGLIGHRISASGNGRFRNANLAHDSYGEAEYNIYTLLGWGSYDKIRKTEYRSQQKGWGTGFSYYGRWGELDIRNEASYRYTEQRLIREESSGLTIVEDRPGIYRLQRWSNALYLSREGEVLWNQFRLHMARERGKDLNHLYAGRNYSYEGDRLSASWLFRPQRSQLFSAGISAVYHSVKKVDLNASHRMEYANIGGDLFLERLFPAGKLNYIVGARLALRYNQRESFQVPEDRRNIITREVLEPRFLYETANLQAPGVKLGLSRTFSKLTAELLASYSAGITKALSGRQRHYFSLQLNFYH